MDLTHSEQEQKIGSYRLGLGQMSDQNPDLISTYNRFTGVCFSEGELSAKQKQLIALGISLFANNEICTLYHTEEALQDGASEQEILEAVAVAAALGGGHSMSQGATRVQQVMDQHFQNMPSNPSM